MSYYNRHLSLLALYLSLLLVRAANAGELDERPGVRREPGALGTSMREKLLQKDLEVKCYLGFYQGSRAGGSPFMLDSWVPLHLIIRNNTKKIFEGSLSCMIKDRRPQNTYRSTFRTRVILAGRGSRKHIELDVYAPQATLGAGGIGGNFTVTLGSVTHYPFAIQKPNTGLGRERVIGFDKNRILHEMVLVLAEHNVELPVKLKQGEERINLTRVQGDLVSLPRRWIAYSGISSVLWDGLDITRLDDFLRQAIKHYVAAGGHLVIAAGENRDLLLRDGFLMQMLPCALGPNRVVDLGRELLGVTGRDRAMVTRLVPGNHVRIIAKDRSGNPLAVRQDFGAGAVTVLAFSLRSSFCRKQANFRSSGRLLPDPAYRRWRSWINPVVRRTHDFLQAQAKQDIRRCGYNYLNQTATKHIPRRKYIFAFLVVYLLVLVPLNYILMRGIKRIELAWLATPFLSLVFFGGAYWIAFRNLSTNISITDISIMRMADNGLGGNFTMSLIHNPSYSDYDLGFTDPCQVPLYLRSDTFPGIDDDTTYNHLFTENNEHGIFLAHQKISFNTSRTFESSGIARMGKGIRLQLTSRPGAWDEPVATPLGLADNRTGHYLSDIALVAGGRAVLLAPLPPVDRAPLLFAGDEPAGPITEICERLCLRAGLAPMRDLLLLSLELMAAGEERAFLVGITRFPMVRWQVNGKPAASKGLTIFAVPVDYADPERLEFKAPRYPADDERYFEVD